MVRWEASLWQTLRQRSAAQGGAKEARLFIHHFWHECQILILLIWYSSTCSVEPDLKETIHCQGCHLETGGVGRDDLEQTGRWNYWWRGGSQKINGDFTFGAKAQRKRCSGILPLSMKSDKKCKLLFHRSEGQSFPTILLTSFFVVTFSILTHRNGNKPKIGPSRCARFVYVFLILCNTL